MTVTNVLAVLSGVRGNGPWTALCPAHDDTHSSLSVKEDGGRALWKCHAGCSQKAVTAAIRAKLGAPSTNRKPTVTYEYTDGTGTPVFYRDRFEWFENGKRQKSVYPRQLDGSKKGTPPVPYRLHELKRAIAAGETVILCEGEKPADALREHGYVATTTGGATSWQRKFAEHFSGANIVLWPDADAPGESYIAAAGRDLAGVAAEIRVVRFQGKSSGWDAADYFAEGGTEDQLDQLLSGARLYEVGETTSPVAADSPANEDDLHRRTSSPSVHIRLDAYPNGKARTPVRFLTLDGTQLTPLHAIDLASETARRKVIDALPPVFQEEGDAMLEELAVAVVRRRHERATAIAAPVASDHEPWPNAVDGAALLSDLSAHIRRYVHLSQESADAIAAWCVLTWCVEWVTFAPLLALLSASKRCGKSLLLDIVSRVVRRGRLTSAGGITPAVIFRLNERDHPTFCIDEAEKLSGRHTDAELVGMLNVGYRRGAKTHRCVERGGSFDVEEFDAFGFRAAAAIGTLWDTLTDRAIVIRLARKPKEVSVERFVAVDVEAMGAVFARRIRRWVTDHQPALEAAVRELSRPLWLTDRDCDNWEGLSAIASVAGGEWPDRTKAAAHALASNREDDGDEAEKLVHDLRALFDVTSSPEMIESGELVKKLNEIETSPWGAKRDGRGITAHWLAPKMKAFDVKPRADRNTSGVMKRGYWLSDLREVFQRYPNFHNDLQSLQQLKHFGREEGGVVAEEEPDEATVARLGLADGL